MRTPVFGKRVASPPPPSDDPKLQPGHQHVLRHLRELDATDPHARPRMVGNFLWETVVEILSEADGRVRIEDALGILASVGGHVCLLSALKRLPDTLANELKKPVSNDSLIVSAQGHDGHLYYFGNLPNEALLESDNALLYLALGTANHFGSKLTMDDIEDVMRHVMASCATKQFGIPRLPAGHELRDSPFNFIKYIAPKLLNVLYLYDVSPVQWPAAFGHAIAVALDASKEIIDPTLAARIILECAVPASKYDPMRFSVAA